MTLYNALLKDSRKKVNLETYTTKHKGEPIICPICEADIRVDADQSLIKSAYFIHPKNSVCPSMKKKRVNYSDALGSQTDKENGKDIIEFVKNHTFDIYSKCAALADGLTVSEFRDLIRVANEKDFWYQKGLTPLYVPYVLLTFKDKFIEAEGGKTRNDDFYFVLEPSVQTIDQLWGKPTKIKQKIWKVYASEKNDLQEYIIQEGLIPPSWFSNTQSYIDKLLQD
ncbi:hypothetical protein GBN78_08275 [Bacillus sp. B2-WWTP-C-10-Post-4]|uniref:hypothetical protein n=1 Tax=Bacillus sp. B2-WWTP-C-10-Post-4 TaxID=2653218 RepID=UPI001261F4AF|nr:hypothetical protein [Bacillus sp. B2-WWTP-C-10-Post-4]KAB7657629.1 hypothetical protein GBN78_08275 [Bacillus sp. B2-WWTP-C-10-Post-4]